MISYNKTWLANLRLRNLLENDLNQGNITASEFASIAEKYPVGFYTPNLLPRIGLFILTCVIVFFTDGLLSIMAGYGVADRAGWFFFLGSLSYIALELVVRFKNHYRSGVDDALLIISGCLFIGGLYMLFYKNSDDFKHLTTWEIVFVVSLWLSIRFADMLASAVCVAALFSIILYGWTNMGSIAIATAPFVMAAAAAFVHWRASYYKKKKSTINYQNCLVIVQVAGLIVLYAAGNYYVIQTLGSELKGIANPENTAIPFGAFFWVWTILLPFVYVGLGIKKKNWMLLRTGLVLIAAATLTFRNYYHLLPVDIELTIIGIIILAIVYATMKYLKTPKHGITYAASDAAHPIDQLRVESLIVAETFSHTPAAPTDQGVKFGGGDFGGGGSSGGF